MFGPDDVLALLPGLAFERPVAGTAKGGRTGHGVTSRGDLTNVPDPARRHRGQAPGPHRR